MEGLQADRQKLRNTCNPNCSNGRIRKEVDLDSSSGNPKMVTDSSAAYLLLAGLYLVGAIGGLVVGSHVGEFIGKRWEKSISGLFAGAAVGGTLGCIAMYIVARWVLPWAIALVAE
ncbi:MAG: hypothetical protein ACUVX8_08405 [Candidatus Zipacnadales bacterium]